MDGRRWELTQSLLHIWQLAWPIIFLSYHKFIKIPTTSSSYFIIIQMLSLSLTISHMS
jgi:hypothetical protein